MDCKDIDISKSSELGDVTISPAVLPQGIIVCDLRSALATHADKIQKALSRFQQGTTENGLFIFVSDNVVVDEPILIQNNFINPTEDQAVFHKLIFCGKNSRITLVESFNSNNDAEYYQHNVTLVELKETAQLNHIYSQSEGEHTTHIADTYVEQFSRSHYHCSSFSTGGKLHRQTWQIHLQGEEANSTCRGLSITNKAQQSEYHVTMNHEASTCFSDQQFKAIADDKSRAIYNGKVVVTPSGKNTIAHQQSRNLLLSSSAEIDTRPELEIYTDDVKCSHGASVGEIDSEQLFYLQSRGIAIKQAKEILLQAFIHDHIETLLPEIQRLIAPTVVNKLTSMSEV